MMTGYRSRPIRFGLIASGATPAELIETAESPRTSFSSSIEHPRAIVGNLRPTTLVSWIVLCHGAYSGARRGVEGLEFTGDVGPGGLVDDFADAFGGVAYAAAALVGRAG